MKRGKPQPAGFETAATLPTPLVPSIAIPNPSPDPKDSADQWEKTYWSAARYRSAIMVGFNLAKATHFNPEYFLADWCDTILKPEAILQDVLGWALWALETEQEYYKQAEERRNGKKPSPICPGDLLNVHTPAYLLKRLKEWVQGRLAYHRTALKLTFCRADPLASKEPVASSVERLKDRFADWHDVRLSEQMRLFESDPKVKNSLGALGSADPRQQTRWRTAIFRGWLGGKGLQAGAITWEAIEWLCWLHLVGPISKNWHPREIALAVRKTFADPGYVKAAKAWWENPPASLHYEPVEENDGYLKQIIKKAFPEEFSEWHADWIENRIEELPRFTDTLRKQLQDAGLSYRPKRDRPKVEGDPTPDPLAGADGDWEAFLPASVRRGAFAKPRLPH